MNAPYAEFLRGAQPGESTPVRPEAYSGKIIIFEADRRFEPQADLLQRILKWKRKQGLCPEDGYTHVIDFPDAPTVDVVAWTPFRGFQFRVPNNDQLAPSNRVFFTDSRSLVRWKRRYWEERRHLTDWPFTVFATCYHPSGERLLTSRLLTF